MEQEVSKRVTLLSSSVAASSAVVVEQEVSKQLKAVGAEEGFASLLPFSTAAYVPYAGCTQRMKVKIMS